MIPLNKYNYKNIGNLININDKSKYNSKPKFDNVIKINSKINNIGNNINNNIINNNNVYKNNENFSPSQSDTKNFSNLQKNLKI